MRKSIQKFRQSSIVFEKTGFLCWTLKTLTSSIYHRVQYFLLKLRICFLFTNIYHFFILFKSWVICNYLQKFKKRPAFYTLVFYIFLNNSKSKQHKTKSRTSFCGHCWVENVYKVSAKIIKLCQKPILI